MNCCINWGLIVLHYSSVFILVDIPTYERQRNFKTELKSTEMTLNLKHLLTQTKFRNK